MRTWAVAAGVAGYLVFATFVWKLDSDDAASAVAEWRRLSPDLAPSASAGVVEVGSGALAFHELLAIADHRMYEQQ